MNKQPQINPKKFAPSRLSEGQNNLITIVLPIIAESEKLFWSWHPYSSYKFTQKPGQFFDQHSTTNYIVLKSHHLFGTAVLSFYLRIEFERLDSDKDIDSALNDAFNKRKHRIGLTIKDQHGNSGLYSVRTTRFDSNEKNEEGYKSLCENFLKIWDKAQRCRVCTHISQEDARKNIHKIIQENLASL